MKVLGLVGSRRRLGNTEILTKAALEGARACGAQVELLRLTDLRLEPCSGCMACVLKGVDCPLPDDLHFLLRAMEKADGLVLGAPVYFFGAPGIVKLIVDRFLAIRPGQYDGKKAVTLGVAGRSEWARMFAREVNLLPLIAGFEVVDSLLFAAPGPGEVLLDETNPQRARELGRLLVAAVNGPERPPERESLSCPICFGTSFTIKGPTKVECPLCYVQGDIVTRDGVATIKFDIQDRRFRFFGQQTRAEHLDQWVKRTGPRFRERMRDILSARRPYDNANIAIDWLTLPNAETNTDVNEP